YGADETGIQSGIGSKERVFGPAGSSVQHQQRSGNRENITVLCTICGDGSATDVPPTVIFKGNAFQVNWKQNNPLNASLGYQKKGYIDGEIGVDWMQEFEKSTRAKAGGRRRLLLVDGHVSHYTGQFLRHAREHRIEVVCYPSHSTHVYQGLDVVIFSQLKTCWSRARDEYERR
ncbi:CENP-B protein, partial [Cylindrobasidium torrendii FP15055 ss-10]